jgi:hypothetical protein
MPRVYDRDTKAIFLFLRVEGRKDGKDAKQDFIAWKKIHNIYDMAYK